MNALVLKHLDEASNDGDINKLEQLLREDPLLLDRALTEVRDNPLHIGALQGHVDFTSEVLRLKPELETKLNGQGQSPLHLAAARGHLQVAQILVDKVLSSVTL
jgi:ankyrin repeat protein